MRHNQEAAVRTCDNSEIKYKTLVSAIRTPTALFGVFKLLLHFIIIIYKYSSCHRRSVDHLVNPPQRSPRSPHKS